MNSIGALSNDALTIQSGNGIKTIPLKNIVAVELEHRRFSRQALGFLLCSVFIVVIGATNNLTGIMFVLAILAYTIALLAAGYHYYGRFVLTIQTNAGTIEIPAEMSKATEVTELYRELRKKI